MTPLSVMVLALLTQSGGEASNRSAAYGLFLEALSLREAGKADDALKVLQKALKADPKAAEAQAEIAKIQMDAGRFSPAVAAVDQAVKMAPNRADLRSLAGQIHQFYGQSGGGESELRLAVREYEAAASLDPNDPAPLRDLTRLYSALRDAKGALGSWKRLSEVDPRDVDAFVQVASLSMATGDAPGAVQALETAIQADPRNAHILQLLGDLKQQTGKPEEALRHYEAAAKIDSKDLLTRLKMGELLLDARRGKEALAVSEEMLKQDESNRFALDLKARSLKELRLPDAALEIASSLAASDPRDLKAAFLVVTLLEEKGSLDDALGKLNALIRRNTAGEEADSIARNNRVFWAHTGMVRQRLGQFKEAADAFGEAVSAGTEPDRSLVTYRIDALISAGDFDRALKEARAARAEPAFKDETGLVFLEAYALRGGGEPKEAIALVEAAVAAGKDEPNDILAAAEFHQRGKDLERARELFARVAESDPQNVRGLFGLASVLERQKKFDVAEAVFRKALAVAPDSAITLNYLGYMNADRNVRVEEALAFIQRALAADPDNGSYLDSLAWALHRLGRNGEAETAVRKAIQSQEKNAVVLAHLGLILAAKGDQAEALRYLRLSLKGEDEDGDLDRALVNEKIRALSQAAQKRP